MEELFELYKGTLIIHDKYQGVVCGYNDSHFILAVETKDTSFGFRVLKRDFLIEEPFKDSKYRYIYEDERVIEKFKKQWEQESKQKQGKKKAS